MPDVRSDEDCRRLIASLQMPIYRACFTLIYAYGLRISEAVTLPISAVDSKQMVLRSHRQGKQGASSPPDRTDPARCSAILSGSLHSTDGLRVVTVDAYFVATQSIAGRFHNQESVLPAKNTDTTNKDMHCLKAVETVHGATLEMLA